MDVLVVNRKLIKPCTPTPSDLRTYKISIFDELNEPMHLVRILYYYSSGHGVKQVPSLEESLAKVLPLFYPLAGRYLKEKRIVDCNDEGAEYAEAEVAGVDLLQLINNGATEIISDYKLNNLLPLPVSPTDGRTDPILGVQVNKFRCGGVAIGVCASHRVMDSASLGIFLQAWATAAVNGDLSNICPDFSTSSLFPAENLPAPLDLTPSIAGDIDAFVFRRFVFDSNSISILRDEFHPSPNWESGCPPRPPSRVMVVSAFLTQALLRADRIKHGKSRASLIRQLINIRERTVPPIPKHAMGSWVCASFFWYTASESQSAEHDFTGVVTKIRESIMQGAKDCSRILSDKKFGRWVMVDSDLEAVKKAYSGDYKAVTFTDFTKFGDYELDFGFGKPAWSSLADLPFQDICVLMNNKQNDGIEAWVYLRQTDMYYLQQDEDLKMITS